MGLFKRKNKVEKKARDIREILHWEGPDGCLATNRITVDGAKVGYMYREQTDGRYPDSGWRFFEGTETDTYLDDADNTHIYRLNTICNFDPDIIPFLNAPYGTAYTRDENGVFRAEALKLPNEEF